LRYAIQSVAPKSITFKNNIFLELLSYVIISLNISQFKTTRYTARCSVKSSTNCKVKFILNLDFLFPSKGNLSGAEIMLWCKNNSFTGAKIPFSYFIF
jgi:hypothetical protein